MWWGYFPLGGLCWFPRETSRGSVANNHIRLPQLSLILYFCPDASENRMPSFCFQSPLIKTELSQELPYDVSLLFSHFLGSENHRFCQHLPFKKHFLILSKQHWNKNAHVLTPWQGVLGHSQQLGTEESVTMIVRFPRRLLLWFIALLAIALLALFVVCLALQIQVPWQTMTLRRFSIKHNR